MGSARLHGSKIFVKMIPPLAKKYLLISLSSHQTCTARSRFPMIWGSSSKRPNCETTSWRINDFATTICRHYRLVRFPRHASSALEPPYRSPADEMKESFIGWMLGIKFATTRTWEFRRRRKVLQFFEKCFLKFQENCFEIEKKGEEELMQKLWAAFASNCAHWLSFRQNWIKIQKMPIRHCAETTLLS